MKTHHPTRPFNIRPLFFAAVLALSPPAQADGVSGGLPPPTVDSVASLNKALAEFDRSPNTVIAEIGSRTVTWGDVVEPIRALPRIAAGVPFQALFLAATAEVMQTKALALRGEAVGVDKLPSVQRRIKNAGDEALAAEMLRRSLAPNVSEKGLRSVYDAVVAGKLGPEEVDARIIVLDDKDKANELIQRLQNGAAFTELARDFSKDGTASVGGDLGFARLDIFAPELGSVIFSLGIGQITAFPVKSHNMWYIVRVESRRQSAAPSFEDVRLTLEQDVIHAGTPELRKQALQESQVKYYGLVGKPEDKK